MTVKKSTLEFLFLVSLFIFSFINTITLAIFFIVLLLLFKQRAVGALKIINLISLRTIINPGIATGTESLELMKMGILMIAAIYLITFYLKLNIKTRNKLNASLLIICIFIVYNIIVALFISSLPIVAISKLAFYSIVFLGVLIGVAYVIENFDIFNWLQKWFKLILLFSILLIPFPVAYLRNGIAFQGITNQPNMFGIIAVLIIAVLLSRNIKLNDIFFIFSGILMIVMSNSRTALISLIVVLGLFFVTKYIKKITFLRLSVISFSIATAVFLYRPIASFLSDFILKEQTAENILFSREDQISTLLYNFKQSPIFGNGFSVPVLNFRSFDFSTSYIVEPGNLILAVLSFSGIVGFVIFLAYMLTILLSNKKNLLNKPYLFVAPIIISMGEMVFFSSNNIGPICYMLFAMYMFYDNDKNKLKTSQ